MTEKPLVVTARNHSAYEGASQVLSRMDFPDLSGQNILLKPNAGRTAPAGSGVVTNPQVVAAAIDFFLQRKASVRIGESPILGASAMQTLQATGIAGVANQRGVDLVDLDARPAQKLPVPSGRVLSELRFCPDVLEADLVVSIPVAKTHMHTVVSLGLKNMKGCLHGREKVRLHQISRPKDFPDQLKTLDAAISDLAAVFLPHLALIDGSVGLEGLGPSTGSPKEFSTFVTGKDCLAVDAVTSHLMGFDPHTIPHLRLAAEATGRSINLTDIQTTPTDLSDLINPFVPAPTELSVEYPGVVVHDYDSCSGCLSTVVMLLERYHSELLDYAGPDEKLHIALGKSIGDVSSGTVLIGNCAAAKKTQGLLIKGCPPVASDILAAIRKANMNH